MGDINLRVDAQTREAKAELEQLRARLARLERSDPTIRPRIDNKRAKRELGELDRGISQLAKRAAGAAIAAGAVAGTLALGKALVRSASDTQEQVSKTLAVFGASGKAVDKWSRTMTTSFGISRRSALEFAGSFGALMRPAGILEGQAAKMSKSLTELAGDFASFYNASTEEALTAIKSGLVGETEPLRRFGVMLNAASIEAKAVEMGLGKVGEKLTSGAKMQATYALILKQSTLAQGDFARTSGGLANQQRILRASLDDTAGTFGRVLLPPLTGAVKAINTRVLPQLKSAGDAIAKVWDRPDLGPEAKLSASWDAIAKTGLPTKARDAVLEGFAFVGTNAPRVLLNAMADAPWIGKLTIGALLVAKFGPAFKLLGAGAGKALGGGLAGGGIAGGISKATPVPVFVVNSLPGVGGGVGGGIGGAAGKAGNVGKLAKLGMGLNPIGIGVGTVLGGIALENITANSEIGGALFESKADAERTKAQITRQLIEAARAGSQAFKAEWKRQDPFDFSDGAGQIQRSVATVMASFTKAVDAGKPADAFKRVAQAAGRELKPLGGVAQGIAHDAMVRMAAQMELDGKLPKGSALRLTEILERQFGVLPGAASTAVSRAGKIITGFFSTLATTISSGGANLPKIVLDFVFKSKAPPGRARGGVLPGTYTGKDNMLAAVATGETILTPTQVGLADAGMSVHEALRATGGKVGGGAYAKGGVAGDAAAFARKQVGEPYVWGGGHSFGDSRGWDCSGFASNVAARVQGYSGGIGTTMSLYPKSGRARGSEPVVFGFRGMGSNNARKQHMGIRVDGTWYSAGAGGVKVGDSRWDSLRVPPGLENLADGGGPDKGGSGGGATALSNRTRARAMSGILSPSTPATGISDAGQRGITRSSIAAGQAALKAGGPNAAANAREAADDARRNGEIAWWRNEKANAVEQRDLMVSERKEAVAKLRRLYLNGVKPSERAGVAALQKRIAALNAARDNWNAWLGEIAAQLFELDVQEAEDRQEDIGLPDAGSTGDAPEVPGDNSLAQVKLDQANERERIAQAGYDASESFIRTAFGPGDLSQGGRTAIQAAGGTVNVYALTLGDPKVAQAVIAEIAAAANLSGAGRQNPAVSLGL